MGTRLYLHIHGADETEKNKILSLYKKCWESCACFIWNTHWLLRHNMRKRKLGRRGVVCTGVELKGYIETRRQLGSRL